MDGWYQLPAPAVISGLLYMGTSPRAVGGHRQPIILPGVYISTLRKKRSRYRPNIIVVQDYIILTLASVMDKHLYIESL